MKTQLFSYELPIPIDFFYGWHDAKRVAAKRITKKGQPTEFDLDEAVDFIFACVHEYEPIRKIREIYISSVPLFAGPNNATFAGRTHLVIAIKDEKSGTTTLFSQVEMPWLKGDVQ